MAVESHNSKGVTERLQNIKKDVLRALNLESCLSIDINGRIGPLLGVVERNIKDILSVMESDKVWN